MAKRTPRHFRKRPQNDLRAVIDEAIGLAQRLVWVADQLHGAHALSSMQRGILRGLVRYGDQTVPDLARARSVRRQSVQPAALALATRGLVSLEPNPAHAASKLVRITPRGEAIVHRMDTVDRKALAAAGKELDRHDIETTATTLRALRTRFETTLRWRSVVASSTRGAEDHDDSDREHPGEDD